MFVMIVQPATGTRDEQYHQRVKLRSDLEQHHLEVIDVLPRMDFPTGSQRLLFAVGQQICLLAQIQAVVFMHGWDQDRECRLIHSICEQYGIASYESDHLESLYQANTD